MKKRGVRPLFIRFPMYIKAFNQTPSIIFFSFIFHYNWNSLFLELSTLSRLPTALFLARDSFSPLNGNAVARTVLPTLPFSVSLPVLCLFEGGRKTEGEEEGAVPAVHSSVQL